MSIPRVAAFGVLQVAVGPINGLVVAHHVGADLIAAESLCLLLVGLVLTSVGVIGDDEDPVMLCRRRVVGWEGERGVLEANTTTIFIFGGVHFRFLEAFFGNASEP